MSQTLPPDNTPRIRTGSVRAGRDLKADNIVTGVQVQGADAETARELLTLARELESGSVEAVQDIIAKNIVTGFQYIGPGGYRAQPGAVPARTGCPARATGAGGEGGGDRRRV